MMQKNTLLALEILFDISVFITYLYYYRFLTPRLCTFLGWSRRMGLRLLSGVSGSGALG
jgi:hypothetical protein